MRGLRRWTTCVVLMFTTAGDTRFTRAGMPSRERALPTAMGAASPAFSFSPLPQKALVRGDKFNDADRTSPTANAASRRTTTFPLPIMFSFLPVPAPVWVRKPPP